MKNFLDIPDLPHDAFQPTKIGLRSKMSLHKGGGSSTSYSSAYPEWAEPQVKELFERGNLASLQPYQPYQLGGSWESTYGLPGDPGSFTTNQADNKKAFTDQQGLGADEWAKIPADQRYQMKGGYTAPDQATLDRISTPEGLEAYVNEQTIGKGLKAGLTPLEQSSYLQAQGISTPGMFQNTYSGYTPTDSMYADEKKRYEGQQAFLGDLTDEQAQDIAFGRATPTITNRIPGHEYEGVTFTEGDEGYDSWVDQVNKWRTDVGEAPGPMGWRNKAGEQFFGDSAEAAGRTQFGSGVLNAEGNRIYEGTDAYNELAVEPSKLEGLKTFSDPLGQAYGGVNPWEEGWAANKEVYDTARGETRLGDADYDAWKAQQRAINPDFDSGFTKQNFLDDLEVLKYKAGMLKEGQTGYEGAKAKYDRAEKAGEIDNIEKRYKREGGVNYLAGLPGIATQGKGTLGTAMDRLRTDVSSRDFGSYTDSEGKLVEDKGNVYGYGYQAPTGLTDADIAELAAGGASQELINRLAAGSSGLTDNIYTAPGATTQPDIDAVNATPGLSEAQKTARLNQLGSAANYYEAGTPTGAYTAPETDLTSGYNADTLKSGFSTRVLQNEYDAGTLENGYAARDLTSGYEAGTLENGYAARDLTSDYEAAALGDEAKYNVTDTAIGAFTPEQIQALEAAGYSPTDIGLQDADAGYTARQMVGGEFDAAAAAKYMDPYQKGITDIALESAQAEDLKAQNVLAAQAVQAGAFGGDREAILRSESARNYQKLISDIQTQGSQKAYESAQAQFEADRAARMQAQQLTEGFRQKAAELDKSSLEFDETSDQTAARIGLEGYAKEQAAQQTQQQLISDAYAKQEAAKQTQQQLSADVFGRNELAAQTEQQLAADVFGRNEASTQKEHELLNDMFRLNQDAKQKEQQLTTDAWKANQAAAQVAGSQSLDSYAKEQAAKQTQQQLTTDAWKANQAAGQVAGSQSLEAYKAEEAAKQAAARGQLDADKMTESSGQFAATNALNRAKTENDLFVSQAQLEMAASKLNMEQIQLANKLGGQQRGFTQQQLDLLQNEHFAGQGWDQQQLAWLGALFSGSLLPNTGQKADSGESLLSTLVGTGATTASLFGG